MVTVYLSLGSNMGDRVDFLNKAIDMIKEIPDSEFEKVSSFYETPPWGVSDQQDFINACVRLSTNLSPLELLEKLHHIEQNLHRERIIRWGPRTIDIDILIFGDIICEDKNLIIPHPRISQRAFVLVPLFELDQDLIIGSKTVKEMMGDIDASEIKEYKSNDV